MSRKYTYLANFGVLLVSALLSALVLEAAVRVLNLWPQERAATRGEADAVDSELFQNSTDVDEEEPASKVVLHPFLGWSTRPRLEVSETKPSPLRVTETESAEWERRHRRPNVFGFYSAVQDPRQLRRKDFVIGIFGGSVAMNLARIGGDALVRQLETRHPELIGSIYVLNLATGGYKQPQQLFLFQQMMMLGVPIDVAVNLDGFNEVALSAADAIRGQHPIFPYRAHLASAFAFNSGSPSTEEIERTADILRQKRRTAELENVLTTSPLRDSELVRALQGRRILNSRKREVEFEQALRENFSELRSASLIDLPAPCLGKGFKCWRMIIQFWKQSSFAMEASARRFGVKYLHLLQPNQYVEGSKPLSEEERRLYYKPDNLWSRAVTLGFPHLQHNGKALIRRGVSFSDLTGLFVDHPETLYEDDCCHLNRRGNQILGTAVGDRIADLLDRTPQE